MPCQDPTEQLNQQTAVPMWEHTQTVIRLACDRCRELETRGGAVPEWAKEFWDEHKQRDEERLQREAKAQHGAEIRKQAIAKLTPEERSELGV